MVRNGFRPSTVVLPEFLALSRPLTILETTQAPEFGRKNKQTLPQHTSPRSVLFCFSPPSPPIPSSTVPPKSRGVFPLPFAPIPPKKQGQGKKHHGKPVNPVFATSQKRHGTPVNPFSQTQANHGEPPKTQLFSGTLFHVCCCSTKNGQLLFPGSEEPSQPSPGVLCTRPLFQEESRLSPKDDVHKPMECWLKKDWVFPLLG